LTQIVGWKPGILLGCARDRYSIILFAILSCRNTVGLAAIRVKFCQDDVVSAVHPLQWLLRQHLSRGSLPGRVAFVCALDDGQQAAFDFIGVNRAYGNSVGRC
jgi:hypothetical protein